MSLRRIGAALAGMAAAAIVLTLIWPQAGDAAKTLLAQDDPARLSDAQLDVMLRIKGPSQATAVIEQHIAQALVANDADLAASFVALARERGIFIMPEILQQVAAALAQENTPGAIARRFATGFVTGDVGDAASLSGTVAGDLFVFGDIRDVVRQGKRIVMGEEPDHLILGLAGVGLAATAATYVSAGGAMPLRAGLTMLKDARKVGAMKAAFRVEKAGALVRLAKDVGRISERAGTKGALDVLRVADGPKDVARAARLAQAKGGQTRAIVKILGRGALLLTAGAFNLASWLFAALLALVGVLASIKATTERLTLWWLRRAKSRRAQAGFARFDLAMTQTRSA